MTVIAAYWLSAEAGLQLALVRGQVTPLWPPTGIALACLLAWGVRIWPAITVGAFLVNLPIGPTLPAVCLIAVGNTLAPVCACVLLSRIRFRADLGRLRDAVALVFLGALGSMLISATVGTATLTTLGTLPLDQFWSTWSVWWSGDAMGVLTVTPLLLAARHTRWPPHAGPRRWLQAAGVVTGVGVAAAAAWAPSQYHLSFLVFPVLVWAATRFHLAGAAPCVVLMAVTVILAAAHHAGPFTGLDMVPTTVDLQAFNASVALTGLLLAALTSQRDRARHEVEQACAQLADTLAALQLVAPLLTRLVPRNTRRAAPDTHQNNGNGSGATLRLDDLPR